MLATSIHVLLMLQRSGVPADSTTAVTVEPSTQHFFAATAAVTIATAAVTTPPAVTIAQPCYTQV